MNSATLLDIFEIRYIHDKLLFYLLLFYLVFKVHRITNQIVTYHLIFIIAMDQIIAIRY
jgi:hypothetical protein